jgi:hypothetical protein
VISRNAAPRERNEPREIVELRALRVAHPELEPAIDLQLELLDIQRRVMPRITLPAALLGSASSLPAGNRPLLTWAVMPMEWSEFRAVLRETIDVLRRTGNVEHEPALFLTALAREGNRLPAFIEAWFRDRIEGQPMPQVPSTDSARIGEGTFDSTLLLALRPFLARCVEAVAPRLNLDSWQKPVCPLCHGEPELAIVSDANDRVLVCGRCTLRWRYPSRRCAFCENTDPHELRSFASPDRIHWVFACDRCQRYLKAFDERHAHRPALPGVDTIAMLPLDALAIQKGYTG